MDSRLGKQHPTLRRVRALRKDAALRRTDGVFVAEGRHLTQEALAEPGRVEQVLYSEPLTRDADGRALLERIVAAGVPHAEVAHTVLASLQDARSPQPVLTVARRSNTTLEAGLESAGSSPLCVVAHGVQDPGNLGGLWRTADAAGADLFVATGESADLYHPRTVRATMGSVFRLPATGAELLETLTLMRAARLRTVATTPTAAGDYTAADFSGGCVVVLGGEGAGLPEELLRSMDTSVRIPMREGVESLSVGAAAAVILFEAARQRTARG